MRPDASTPPDDAPRLLDALRQQVRYRHYSIRTEEAYVHWVRAFVRFHGLRHLAELAQPEVEAFLTWLANERQVAAATHKQALSALLFLYQQVLHQPVAWMDDLGRPRTEKRLPVVLSVDEVTRLLRLGGGAVRSPLDQLAGPRAATPASVRSAAAPVGAAPTSATPTRAPAPARYADPGDWLPFPPRRAREPAPCYLIRSLATPNCSAAATSVS